MNVYKIRMNVYESLGIWAEYFVDHRGKIDTILFIKFKLRM